jgi:hypothetical protein
MEKWQSLLKFRRTEVRIGAISVFRFAPIAVIRTARMFSFAYSLDRRFGPQTVTFPRCRISNHHKHPSPTGASGCICGRIFRIRSKPVPKQNTLDVGGVARSTKIETRSPGAMPGHGCPYAVTVRVPVKSKVWQFLNPPHRFGNYCLTAQHCIDIDFGFAERPTIDVPPT